MSKERLEELELEYQCVESQLEDLASEIQELEDTMLSDSDQKKLEQVFQMWDELKSDVTFDVIHKEFQITYWVTATYTNPLYEHEPIWEYEVDYSNFTKLEKYYSDCFDHEHDLIQQEMVEAAKEYKDMAKKHKKSIDLLNQIELDYDKIWSMYQDRAT